MSAIFTKDFFTHMYRRKNFIPRLASGAFRCYPYGILPVLACFM